MYKCENAQSSEYKISCTEINLFGEKCSAINICFDLSSDEQKYTLNALYIPENDGLLTSAVFFQLFWLNMTENGIIMLRHVRITILFVAYSLRI